MTKKFTPETLHKNAAFEGFPKGGFWNELLKSCALAWEADLAELARLRREAADQLAQNQIREREIERLRALVEKQRAVMAGAMPSAVWISRLFHEVYEGLAPGFGWHTALSTRKFDPSSPNGRLMAATITEVFRQIGLPLATLAQPSEAFDPDRQFGPDRLGLK